MTFVLGEDMKEEIDAFDFVEVIFCFTGIFEEYIKQYQEYKQLGIDISESKGETGSNPECDIIDYKDVPVPPLLKKQNDLLYNFIINSSEDEKLAMDAVVDDSLDYLEKELDCQYSDIRIIKSRLKKIIQHSGELKTIKCKDDLMSCYELWELSKLCLKYNIERPIEFVPADEQIELNIKKNKNESDSIPEDDKKQPEPQQEVEADSKNTIVIDAQPESEMYDIARKVG